MLRYGDNLWSVVIQEVRMSRRLSGRVPTCYTQMLHGQAFVLQQTSANLTNSSSDVKKLHLCRQPNHKFQESFSCWSGSVIICVNEQLSQHILYRFLSAKSTQPYNLRARRHSFPLLQNNPAVITVISSPAYYYAALSMCVAPSPSVRRPVPPIFSK